MDDGGELIDDVQDAFALLYPELGKP
jgi:hypothetical protein